MVAHQKTLAAAHIAEKLDIPHVQALTVPMLTPTREFPLPAMIRRDLGGRLNRASYRLVGLLTAPYARLIRRWRKDHLDLPGRGKPPAPARTLYSYSPSLVPTPPDWPPHAVATGYWLRHAGDEEVDQELEAFVTRGEPPVYIGFGSSVGAEPSRLGAAVSGAMREVGARAAVATGWGGIGGLDGESDTMVVERAPHRWLFPHVAAVVHHGGSGTTAAGLLAGRPPSCARFRATSTFWAEAVHRAGVGPEPRPAKTLTAEHLAAAIRAAIESSNMRAHAAELSQRLHEEDGTRLASRHIEETLA